MIPIAKPFLGEEEAVAARRAILSGWVTQGPRVKEFEEAFSDYVGARYACATSSCTVALHLALLGVGVSPGDVVVTVSHSFIATANAVRYCLAEPMFVDICPDTFNMSPDSLNEFLRDECERRDGSLFYRNVDRLTCASSPLSRLRAEGRGRVAAVMPVHQVGIPCDMKHILDIANSHGLPVVEDAACAVGAEIQMEAERPFEKIGKPHGDVACFSFHPRKIMTTGEGGMLTTNSREMDAKFRLLRQHGMSVPDTARHNSDRVVFEEYLEVAFNYRMTDIQAAIGIEQLKRLPEFIARRKEIHGWYHLHMGKIPWLELPSEPAYAKVNWQSYPVLVLPNSPLPRDAVLQALLHGGVSVKPGIMNAHAEPPYRGGVFSLPVSELVRANSILLPIFHGLEESDVRGISEILKAL